MNTPGMDLSAYCRKHRVRFVRKDRSLLMRAIAWLLGLFGYDFLRRAWTTVGRTVYYPTTGPSAVGWWTVGNERTGVFAHAMRTREFTAYLEQHRQFVEHELHHVEQFRRLWHLHSLLYLLGLPLPLGFAWYRWRCERVAYLHQIRHYVPRGFVDNGDLLCPDVREFDKRPAAAEQAVNTLWRVYGFCWPRAWMRRWFTKQLETHE